MADQSTTFMGIRARFEQLLQADAEAPIAIDQGAMVSRQALAIQTSDLVAILSEQENSDSHSGARFPLLLQAANGSHFLAAILALDELSIPVLLVDPGTTAQERKSIITTMNCTRSLLLTGQHWNVQNHMLAKPIAPPDPQTAVIKMSSGSSGKARGILVSEKALIADAMQLGQAMQLENKTRLLAAIPMAHSYGFSVLTMPALILGCTLVIPSGDPLAAARQYQAEFFPSVPAYYQGLHRAQDIDWPQSLKLCVSAGAPLSKELAIAFRQKFGQSIHSFYGSSECGGICYDAQGLAAERGTVGKALPAVTVHLGEDGEAGQGPVSVRSTALAFAYYPEPDDRLRASHFDSDDWGSWQNGELRIEGRVNDRINVRGKKVNPREVEQVLCQHPSISEAAVIGVDRIVGADSLRGEDQIVRCYVVIQGNPIGYLAIKDWCRKNLAPHKVPRAIHIVDALPTTERGKLDKKTLLNNSLLAKEQPKGERA